MEKLKYIKPKLFSTMKTYTKEQFVKDIVAGIIVAIIALPLSIALAIASGVNPEQGLYTAIIAGFFISLLGGSRVQIGGPTAAFVVIIYGIIAQYGMTGLTIATFFVRYHHDHHGTVPFRQSDQIYPEDDHGRLYIWYCHRHLRRTAQGLLRSVHGSCGHPNLLINALPMRKHFTRLTG